MYGVFSGGISPDFTFFVFQVVLLLRWCWTEWYLNAVHSGVRLFHAKKTLFGCLAEETAHSRGGRGGGGEERGAVLQKLNVGW